MKKLFGTRFSRFRIHTFTMSERVILAVSLPAVAALNLLKPSATIGTALLL
jgi:hypothetical protein